MKRVICAAVLTAASAMPGLAADYPAATASYYDWTGAYFGIHTGYVWGEVETTSTPTTAAFDLTYDLEFALAGVHLGYNHQVGNNFVVGFEVDASFSDAEERVAVPTTDGFQTDLDWLATARLRLGYSFDNFLLFATAGGAAAETDDRVYLAGGAGTLSERRSRKGWTAGAGFEWGFAENWTASGQYLYVDLGDETVSNNGGLTLPAPTTSVDFEHIYHLGRVGVNYRF